MMKHKARFSYFFVFSTTMIILLANPAIFPAEGASDGLIDVFPGEEVSEQQPEQHPIDKWFEEQDAISTEDMLDTLTEAEKKWDAELNAQYQKLMSKLSPANKNLLRDSQRKWLAYRDTEFKFIDGLIAQHREKAGGGTVWGILHLDYRVRIVRSRVLALTLYANGL